jgi:hypothetical protein
MDRMGVLRPFIGIALLRSKGVEAVPQHFTEEPLSGKRTPLWILETTPD